MTFRLDAQQLDRAWDASVLGAPFPIPVEDPEELWLFGLLAEVDRAAADPAFFRELERRLALDASSESIRRPSVGIVAARAPIHSPSARPKLRPSSRGSIPAYALAAVALLLTLSTAFIALPRFGSESDRSIPAVRMWEEDGPPTSAEVAPAVDAEATPGPQSSPGLQSKTLFAHAFTPEELTNYQFDQWGWIGLAHGSVPPGGQPPTEDVSEVAASAWTPGVQVIEVETGTLVARPNGPAILTRGAGGASEEIGASTNVTMSPGDALMFGPDAIPAVWNTNAEPATYITGGLNATKDYPILVLDTSSDDSDFGFTGDRSIFARTSLLDLSIERVSIAPGQTYAYAITSNTLLMSSVTGKGLQLSRWLDANESDNLGQVSPTIYSLHEYGDGYYTLTNTGTETVDVYLLEVAPPVAKQLTSDAPTASVETMFDQTLTRSELSSFQPDQWQWVELARGYVDPGGVWRPSEDATPTTGLSWPGMTVFSVEYGEFTVALNGTVFVTRSGMSEPETVTAPGEVVLAAGDSMRFAPGAVASAENRISQIGWYVIGGLSERAHRGPQRNDVDNAEALGGTTFDAALLEDQRPIDFSIDKVTIAPGGTFAYTLSPNSLLLAYVTNEGLQKSAWDGSELQGDSQRLLASHYTLHRDAPGGYILRNTGLDPVDVFLFGVEPAHVGAETSAPAATAETLFSKTLTPEEMALYASDEWRWISFSQGTLQPGDRAIIAEGSPTAKEVGSDLNGLGAISILSGELVANAASGAVIERGTTGAIERIDRRADVILGTGDTLIAPATTLPAIWNKSDADASYLAGGVYIKRNISPLNELDFDFTKGGITVHPTDLATGTPVTMSLQHITMPPGASFAYTSSPATWLEAIVSGGELRQETTIDGIARGKPKTLLEGLYSLQSDGPGDYTLTNDGTETVEISFFRVEAPASSDATASPVASSDRDHE